MKAAADSCSLALLSLATYLLEGWKEGEIKERYADKERERERKSVRLLGSKEE